MLEAFRKVSEEAKKIKADQLKEKQDEERRRQDVLRKKREREQQEAAKPAITELTDEEADKLEKEIAAEKYELQSIDNIDQCLMVKYILKEIKERSRGGH